MYTSLLESILIRFACYVLAFESPNSFFVLVYLMVSMYKAKNGIDVYVQIYIISSIYNNYCFFLFMKNIPHVKISQNSWHFGPLVFILYFTVLEKNIPKEKLSLCILILFFNIIDLILLLFYFIIIVVTLEKK